MKVFHALSNDQKLYAAFFLLGFLLKYNYLALQIFQVPSLTGLIFKNGIIVLFIFVYVLPLVQNRQGRNVVLYFLFAFSVFFLLTIWYNRYFGNYLSLSDILMGRGVRPFKVLLNHLMRPYDAVFILDCLVLFVFRTNVKRTVPVKNAYGPRFRRRGAFAGLIVAGLLLLQIAMTNTILGNKRPIALFNRSTSAFVNVYGLVPLYAAEYYILYHSHTEEAGNVEVKPPSAEGLLGEKIVEKDENIIVIQVESLDQKIIDFQHKGRPVTPFLNALKDKSLYFENFYAQHVNGSFDSEFSFLTSIYPVNKNYGFKINDLSVFESLVKIFKKKGYSAQAFHGNEKTFFYRHKAFPELGFDTFYGREDFSFEDKVMDVKNTGLGLNDYDFFLQSLDFLKEAEQPFFAFFITVTSHTPFDFYPPWQTVPEFSDVNNELVRDYFNSIAFVDKSLRMFFEKLEDLGLDENTLILVYSDHESGIEKEEYSSKRNFILKSGLKPPENIPLFIIHPDIAPGVVKTEGSTTDLAPTILDICGEKEKPEEFLGRSLIHPQESPLLFLHEIPQILYKSQLFARLPTGIEKIGFLEQAGEKDSELPDQENILHTIEFMKNIIFTRRVEF